jgi:hypothetical protein
LHHPGGSIAIAVVAIAIPTPSASSAVVNLIIDSSPKSDNRDLLQSSSG